ncbi:MAG: hypothetical protein JXB88_14765 [Spirochaetales bacterium]|nr:hypothetical protein [Spirochaetales bacterium]
MKRIILLPVIISCFLFFTCDIRKEHILEKYIPSNSLAVVQVLHPDTFFENIDAFMKPLGGIPLMGDVPVKDFLKSVMGPDSPVQLEWFDFTKPWGGALFPRGNYINDFSFLLCIPVLRTADHDAMEKQALLLGFKETVISGNYILLYSQGKPESMVKQEKKIDLSRLSAFDKGALAYQINVRNIFASTGLNSTLVTNLLKTLPASSLGKNTELVMGLFMKIFEAIEQVEEISAGILLNEKGMSIKTFTKITSGGWLNDCLSKLTVSSGIKEYVKYIPREYLFSMVLNMNGEFFSDFIERYYQLILPYMEIKPEDTDKLLDAMKKSVNASGRRMAMAMDIGFDFPEPGDLAEKKIPGQDMTDFSALMESFSLSYLACIELKDTTAYRNAMEEFVKSNIVNALSNETGIEFSIEYNKDREKDGITCDELRYRIDTSDIPADTEKEFAYEDMIRATSNKFLKDFFDRFIIYLGYIRKHCYMTSGDSGIEQLKHFLEKDEYNGSTLMETDVYNNFTAEIPGNAHFIGHFSIPRIMSMIPGIPETDVTPGLIFYGKYVNTVFESGCYWDIGEIKTLYNQFSAMIPFLLNAIP